MADSPATTAAGGGEAVPMLVSSVWWLGETVPDSEHGQHVAGPPRHRLDLPPDVLDMGVERPLVGFESDPFHRIEALGPGEGPAGLPCPPRQGLDLGLP